MPTKTFPPAVISEDRTQKILAGVPQEEQTWRTSLFPGTDTYEVNPYWRQQIAKGQNATTSRIASRYRVLAWKPAKATLVRSTTTVKASRATAMSSLLSVSHDLNALDAIAIKRALSSVSTFAGWTFLGELRETLGLIQDRSSALLGSVLGLHKKQASARQKLWRNPKRLAKRLSQNWLEANFGWLPLIHDVNELYAVLQKKFEEPDRIAIRASARTDKLSSAQSVVNGGSLEKLTLTRTNWSLVRISYTGEAEPVVQTNADLDAQLGLLPDEVILSAWELLPYSFLIDYFSNIGDLLNLQVLVNRVNLVWLSKSVKYVDLHNQLLEHVPQLPELGDRIYDKQIGHALIKNERITRSRETSFSLPYLDFKADLSLRQGLNVAALGTLKALDLRWKPGVI